MINEKQYITVNGIRQGMFLRGENLAAPILLFLHGGPGAPELPIEMANETKNRLEKEFIVCYWEQRGAGMSYAKTITPESMTVATLVEDTFEVTKYLKDRFNVEKIFLLGHSWGSFLSIKTVEKYPEEYYALINVGQVCNQLESEKIAYLYMKEQAKQIGNLKAQKQLQKYDVNSPLFPEHKYMMTCRTKLMNKYGIGLHHNPNLSSNLVRNVLFFKPYSLLDKIRFVQGMMFSNKCLFHCVLEENLFEDSLHFKIPLYILQGKYDYQTSYTLARQYLEMLTAPQKEFYCFEHSAHSPIWEEPEKFMAVIGKIKNSTI